MEVATVGASGAVRRIVFLLDSTFPHSLGGRETFVRDHARRFAADNEVFVITMRSRQAVSYYDIPSEVHIIPVPSLPGRKLGGLASHLPNPFKSLAQSYFLSTLGWSIIAGVVARRLVRGRTATVIAMNPGFVFAAAWFGSRRKALSVCCVRGNWPFGLTPDWDFFRSFYPHLEKWSLSKADLVLANGPDTLARILPISHQSRMIPNAVEIPPEDVVAPTTRGGAPLVLYLASYSDEQSEPRGHSSLIRAAVKLPPSVRVRCVGSGDSRTFVKIAEQLGARDRVQFAGPTSRPREELLEADVVLGLYMYSQAGAGGISHSTIEAMACGRPIVAWDNPTYRQILKHGETGHLVRDADPDALAEGIMTLLSNPVYAAQLGSRAREAARAYDINVVHEQFRQELGRAERRGRA